MNPLKVALADDEPLARARLGRLLREAGCEVLEMATTPALIPWGNESQFATQEQWEQLKTLELEVCTRPELLGAGYYLLCVARKC